MANVEINPYKGENGAPQLRPSVAAHLDILGYSDYISELFKDGKGEKELVRLRNALDEAYQDLKARPNKQIFSDKLRFQVRSFTDNLFIGYPIPEHDDAWGVLRTVVDYIGHLQMTLALDGYFIRGAISVGDLYVDEDIVFGPALMEAVRAEKQLAVFPRVVLCDSAEEPFQAELEDKKVLNVLIDSDRRVFIDYLNASVMIAQPGGPVFTEFLEGHKTTIVAKLEQFTNKPYIRAKYEWAAIYHNAFCESHPTLFDENDRISCALLAPPPQAWIARPSKVE
jgi:hypothetical protein